ncbi:MAG: hypothetical protein MZW92_64320 [Comamonadaceae bacterium]|nr:hypothetical protein [Comamonadaceae bacterium]
MAREYDVTVEETTECGDGIAAPSPQGGTVASATPGAPLRPATLPASGAGAIYRRRR